MVNTMTVKELVNHFSLEIIAGEDYLQRIIVKSKTRRPGLEFIDYFDFLPMQHVKVLGENEITYLHMLDEEERNMRVGNLIKYDPPCIVVTDNQEELTYLTKYCTKEKNPSFTNSCNQLRIYW